MTRGADVAKQHQVRGRVVHSHSAEPAHENFICYFLSTFRDERLRREVSSRAMQSNRDTVEASLCVMIPGVKGRLSMVTPPSTRQWPCSGRLYRVLPPTRCACGENLQNLGGVGVFQAILGDTREARKPIFPGPIVRGETLMSLGIRFVPLYRRYIFLRRRVIGFPIN